jgi:hypothetical protein
VEEGLGVVEEGVVECVVEMEEGCVVEMEEGCVVEMEEGCVVEMEEGGVSGGCRYKKRV